MHFETSAQFYFQEQMDGAATVAWMRQQPWCNGKVGATGLVFIQARCRDGPRLSALKSSGGSYLGFTAWACVDGSHLDAIEP